MNRLYDKNSVRWQRARALKGGQLYWIIAQAPLIPHDGAPPAYVSNYRLTSDSDAAVFMPAESTELLPEFANGCDIDWIWTKR